MEFIPFAFCSIILHLSTHLCVNCEYFYPTSFRVTEEWRETFRSCERAPNPNIIVSIDNLLITSTNQRVKAIANPYRDKVPTPISLEYPFDNNDLSIDRSEDIRTIFFDNEFNENSEEHYSLSYYYPRVDLPNIHDTIRFDDRVEVAFTRMLTLSAEKGTEDSVIPKHLSLTGFGHRNSSEVTKEHTFSHAVFLGATGEGETSHEIEGTRYQMEIYMYFDDPECALHECAMQLVVLVEESDEENEQVIPLIEAIKHPINGLLNAEKKFLDKYDSLRLNEVEPIIKSFDWRTMGNDMEATHMAYRASSDHRAELRTLQETSFQISNLISRMTAFEPFEFTVKRTEFNGSLGLMPSKLGNYSTLAHEVLDLVNQYLEDLAGDRSDFRSAVQEDNFIDEIEEYEKLFEDFNDNYNFEFQEGTEPPEKIMSVNFINAEPGNTDRRTSTMTEFRQHLATLYKSMRVITNRTREVDIHVSDDGFDSGLQAHNFAPNRAAYLLNQTKIFRETEFTKGEVDFLNLQNEAREKVPKVRLDAFTDSMFHISWLLPKRGGHFFYEGSTPFPPCHIVFRTVVFDRPIKMSTEQIRILTTFPHSSKTGDNINSTRPPFFTLGANEIVDAEISYDVKNHQWSANDGFQEKSTSRLNGVISRLKNSNAIGTPIIFIAIFIALKKDFF